MSKQIIFMDIVQKALIDRHMKKKDLAEKMGKSQKNLSNFWKQDNPTLSTMQSFADALDCDLVISLVPKEQEQEKSLVAVSNSQKEK